jgi:hypothetical protein
MTWLWIALGALAGIAGLRHRSRLRSRLRAGRGGGGPPRVDDEALRRILREGRLDSGEDEPLDMREAARAEDEFWNQPWDEPEEYRG